MKQRIYFSFFFCMLALISLPVNAADEHMHETTADGFPVFNMAVHEHENLMLSKWMLDRFERRFAAGADQTYWEAQAWFGYDEHKLWLKTEGSYVNGKTDEADVEVYFSRAITAFWDAQFGVRHDFAVGDAPSRDWVGVGFQGLAPYMFEVDATAYVGDNGRSAARVKAEYDLWLTHRWILMPEVEMNIFGKSDPERGIGSGLSDTSMTLRLRYDIRRELSPYIGVTWKKKYGGTADYAKTADESTTETYYVLGIRAWW